jgi:UDP-N-acetyl-2-amino-2-deoxyglucuronate dehydrogenase
LPVALYVSGRDRERTERVARKCGARDAILGWERAVDDSRVQAVVLALPHDLHAPVAVRAAECGKHVSVEKPMATTLAGADAMIEAARRAGTVLMVGEDFFFRPSLREAVTRVRKPIFFSGIGGGFHRPSGWRADPQRAGGGILMDHGTHLIRAMRMLMGEPEGVLATSPRPLEPVEDTVDLQFRGASWQARIYLSWAAPLGDLPDIVVAGENGALHLWPGKPVIDFYPAEPTGLTRLASSIRPYWLAENLSSPRLQRIRRTVDGSDGYLAEMREFLMAVEERRSPAITAEEARKDLAWVLAGYESLRSGSCWQGVVGSKG